MAMCDPGQVIAFLWATVYLQLEELIEIILAL